MKRFIALVLVMVCVIILVSCSDTQKVQNTVDLEISIYEVVNGNYTISINDSGYNAEFPLTMDIHFLADNENMIQQDSKDICYSDAATNAQYDSVTVYMNDESETVKYVWITFHGVNLYSDTGKFLKREQFEYELTFRVNTELMEAFDIAKTNGN